jgi:hypothetical protein
MLDKKIAIFLDDERYVEDVTWTNVFPPTKYDGQYDWVIIRSFGEMLELITTTNDWSNIIHISFDHDLGYDFHDTGLDPTGYTCVKMLIDKCMDLDIDPPNCSFHSMNPIGCKNMFRYYMNYLRTRTNKDREEI